MALGLAACSKEAADVEAPTPGPAATDPATVAHGAYLALLGNCAGCHTARSGAAYAGARAIVTPFGTVYSGNLTPDDATGLGRWSADDFWQALHLGRSRDGRLLLPAFPFTSTTRISRADSDALWAYLKSLPAVAQAQRPHELRFPYGSAWAQRAWRWLFFRPAVHVDDPARPAAWNRGAYLVQGLGHCGACHAPRNALGGSGDGLGGGTLPGQPWYAPSLHPAQPGADEARRLVELLKTGQTDQGSALGPMAEVVVRSTQHWRDADLEAVAVYLQSLPPQATTQPAADEPTDPATAAALVRGARLYDDRCADCHGTQGEGVAGIYPPLAANPTVLQTGVANLVQVLLHGGFAPATAAQPRPYSMPPQFMGDAEMADVLSHIRRSWGNRAGAVSTLDVMQAR
ncbi:Putative diheme cytochrome c-553 [Rubrivivax sp. A210]|uniref:c-type cytochrome n=1 Tax=Rubrivivax sp. A210 TaxID=2772301 RepID=UPI0019191700|nr:cytochrome c [Rubrivivax sp. A210]CAD5365994.1 Putative diheme cytochrome c-553 [Rubrivivax sp. A210]